MSSKSQPNVGLIESGLLDAENLQNSFASYIMQGAFRYAYEKKLEIAVYMFDSMDQRYKSFTQFCRAHKLSGVVISGMRSDESSLDELIESRLPTVTIDIPVHCKGTGWVSVNNERATYEMAQYLFGLGHRNIAVINGQTNAAVCDMRLAGVKRAFAEAGIVFCGSNNLYADFQEETAYQVTREFLPLGKNSGCTAFLCFSDSMALGVMRAVQDAGYTIPGDFSVTGFDGLPISAYTSPTLTTVYQDMSQMAYGAVSFLHDMLRGETTGGCRVFPYKIEKRGSSSPPLVPLFKTIDK